MENGTPGRLLRVLSVIPGEPRGMTMIFARRQSKSIAELGHCVREFFVQERIRPLRVVREALRLRHEIKSFEPDVVHAHYGTVTAMVCIVAAGRCPVVVTYRGSDLNPSAAVSKARNWMGILLSQCASLRAGAVICVSKGLRERLWWRRGDAQVLATGVNTDVFRPRDRAAARNELGLPPAAHLVVFNCGFDPWVKRIELAEAAAAKAAELVPDIQLIIMRGDWAPEKVPVLLAAADCLLVTSRFEGSPAIVREALACALPVVSVDVGDVAEHLAGLEGCHLCRADADELGRALAKVVMDGSTSNGRERAELLSEATIARRLVAVYRKVCNPEAASPPTVPTRRP